MRLLGMPAGATADPPLVAVTPELLMESGSPRVVSVRGSGCPAPVARGGAGDVNPWLLCVERRSGGRRTGALALADVRKPGTSAAALSLPSFRAPRTGVPFQRKAGAAESLLRIALHADLQTSAIDGPVAVAWSGGYGRRIGAIAFDGIHFARTTRGARSRWLHSDSRGRRI